MVKSGQCLHLQLLVCVTLDGTHLKMVMSEKRETTWQRGHLSSHRMGRGTSAHVTPVVGWQEVSTLETTVSVSPLILCDISLNFLQEVGRVAI